MAVLDRISIHRSVAVVTDDSIVVRPARARLIVPLIQALVAGAATLLIVRLLNNDGPLLLLVLALMVVLFLGPAAVLGLVFNIAGSLVSIEREKQSVRLQQGFLGLGLGTSELVPFGRVERIEVAGDLADELSSGELQDVVQWDVRVVKDNGRTIGLGSVVAARPFAAEALERANRLALAVGELIGVEARTVLPVEESAEAQQAEDGPAGRSRRRRALRRAGRSLPPSMEPRSKEDPSMDRPLELMRDARTIAVVGVSSNPERDSHEVARYLIEAGYEVFLVNPNEDEVLGRKVYDRVQDLPLSVDIVDVFRRPEHVPPVVEDAIAAGARTVWMQLDIVNEKAASRARAAGLEVVMNRCTKVDHMRLQRELAADA